MIDNYAESGWGKWIDELADLSPDRRRSALNYAWGYLAVANPDACEEAIEMAKELYPDD